MVKIQYKKLLENISDWIWEVDCAGVYTYCTDNVYDYLGYEADKVVGKTPFYFMSDAEAHRVAMIFNSYVEKKANIINFENTHKHKDGHEVVVITNAIAILDANGELLGYQGIDKDISDIKAVKKKLKENEKILAQQSKMAQMGELISMIAHQWRQPLGAISSASIDLQIKMELDSFDLSKQEGRDEHRAYSLEKLQDINGYVQNLTTTLDDFKNFYRPSKKTVITNFQSVILESLKIMKVLFKNEKIEIIQEYNSNHDIELYSNEMIQVILNILKNAQDHIHENKIENGYIKISANDQTISICDNAGGVPTDIMDKIFNPYFSTKDEKNGTGLGLYMSKIIVEKHHGGILKVENSDDGACFTIELGEISN